MLFRQKSLISGIPLAIALVIVAVGIPSLTLAQLKIAKLKYNGGGDWYANKTALPNLISFCNKELGMNLESEEDVVARRVAKSSQCSKK